MMTDYQVICPYCNQQSELVSGDIIYPHLPNLSDRKFWLCRSCDAYVGTHQNSSRHVALGTLANAELRKWRRESHAAFDPLWKAKMKRENLTVAKSRKAGYEWLASLIRCDVKDCYISSADVEMCRQIVEACRPYHKNKMEEK